MEPVITFNRIITNASFHLLNFGKITYNLIDVNTNMNIEEKLYKIPMTHHIINIIFNMIVKLFVCRS